MTRPGLRIERIVSRGQASPPEFWYDQAEAEWVVLLTGAARLRFADETEARLLGPGDWVDIAPHRRHRVEWTDPAVPTVWLAIFYPVGPPPSEQVKNQLRPEKSPRKPQETFSNQLLESLLSACSSREA